ncbi:T9SS type A sorting domain-containing protein [Flavobacterium amniphilum]|uniref:T9SS type A sorting domain-containing protein n=1 Tax=Flavobacterium amniphilum TaxID=1834035 RepID=UPI00202A8DC6|nr:T9SS type A sorting domain-containing protein [Flavobacterium amniphilum]MCL9807032.1 T9SS type A sorting domain-containing protein [Flavobacterium amniphilum]
MRKIIFTKALLLFWGIVSGQCIINGTLESTCTGNGFNASNICVNGWTASHGTPTVMGTVGVNTWAWVWSNSGRGEGIITNYDFQAGRTYRITFDVRASTNISNPNTTVLNSTLNARVTSGINGNTSTAMPTLSGSQAIWGSTVGNAIANSGTGWDTITVTFTPSVNYTQLWFYPMMTATPAGNGGAQIQMEVDNVSIIPPVTSVFHFQDAGGTVKTDFCSGESVFLNGTNSFGENQYYIDVWRRPIGSTASFQWQAQLGANGWSSGQAGLLNLSSIFASQNYSFAAGFEYQVKMATASAPCVGWVESTQTFRVLNNTASPAFTFNSFCAPNGSMSVTATASYTAPGLNQWWALMETNVPGAISDAATIGQVGVVQNGTTVTFTGLSQTKSYYIKHGVYGNCINWTEQRTALPQSVFWSNYTTNFNLAPSANINGTVSVTAAAHSNPVFVNHHWSVYYAPNGSTSGNTGVPGNPVQCCSNASATFSANLAVNQWYYIKHGIYNDCSGWNETRKAFRVVIQGFLADGSPDYAVEEYQIETKAKAAQVSATEDTVLYPNPVAAGEKLYFSTDGCEVSEVQLIDFTGKSHKLTFVKTNSDTIEIHLEPQFKPGVYTLKVMCKDASVRIKKVVVNP